MNKIAKIALGVFIASLYSGVKLAGVLTTKTYNNPDDVASGESEVVKARAHFASNYVGEDKNYTVPLPLVPIVVIGYMQKTIRLAVDHQIRLVDYQNRISPEQYLNEV